jgi:8-oxo-dGTP pyrophosphatase MutT (NUDIX family)
MLEDRQPDLMRKLMHDKGACKGRRPLFHLHMKQKTLSAGIVLLRREQHTCLYLLLRCYNYWDFPKGMVEVGESPLSAACREVCEETSITDLAFPWGQAFVETLPYGRGKVARYYLALTREHKVELPVNPQLGWPEHHEFRWLGYREARALLPPRLLPVLDWAHASTGC